MSEHREISVGTRVLNRIGRFSRNTERAMLEFPESIMRIGQAFGYVAVGGYLASGEITEAAKLLAVSLGFEGLIAFKHRRENIQRNRITELQKSVAELRQKYIVNHPQENP